MDSVKKKLLSLALALIMAAGMIPAAMAADAGEPFAGVNTERSGGGGMGTPKGIYDYPELFDENGVMGVVEAGGFYINDFQVPASGEALTALGEDGFTVNGGTMSLTVADGKFKVGKGSYDAYADAIKALVYDELPGGLHLDLYDTDGDQKAEVVKLWYTEGLIVNEITKDADGNYILYRGDLTNMPSHAGRLYDDEHFSAASGEVIKPEHFDTAIQAGDACVFYLTPDGWVAERAVEINGIFEYGEDHGYYQIDGKQYPDTMKYSRDNLIVAQRNGEFTNAHTYFGFLSNAEGMKVSLWLDPKSASPIGMSANENAEEFLKRAVEQSKKNLSGVTLSANASAEQKFAYEALAEGIELAEKTLADKGSFNSEYDFFTYYLYLAQAGTGSDIGAAFSGFFTNAEFGWERMNAFPGFNALFAETEPEPAPAPAGETYTVVSGDCLWNIAARVYGTGTQFGKIAQANGIAAPYTIYVGQVLTIPAK